MCYYFSGPDILIFGGYGTSGYLSSVELVRTGGSNTSTCGASIPDLPVGVYGHSTTVMNNGRILSCGGLTTSGFTDVCWSVTTTENIWTSAPALPGPRAGGDMVTVNGTIVWFGGYDGSSYTDTIYSLVGTWTQHKTKLQTAMHGHCVVSIPNENQAIITGGFDSTGYLTKTQKFILDSMATTTTTLPEMKNKRAQHGCSLVTNNVVLQILVAGGYGSGGILSSSVERMTRRAGGDFSEWEYVGSLPAARYGFPMISLADKIFILGGYENVNYSESILTSTDDGETWDQNLQLETARRYHTAVSTASICT